MYLRMPSRASVQMMTVLSAPPEANRLPSRAKATQYTCAARKKKEKKEEGKKEQRIEMKLTKQMPKKKGVCKFVLLRVPTT